MQKRRGGGANNSDRSGVLPMTEADVTPLSSTRRVRKRRVRKRKGASFFIFGPTFWSLLIVLVMSLLGIFVVKSFLGNPMSQLQYQTDTVAVQDASPEVKRKLPLSHFSSLSYALEYAELVGLYFAASWCPMSTPVTKLLDEVFSDQPGILLQPDSVSTNKKPFAIVYISSDTSEQEMLDYSKKEWINVPFESEDRNNVKKHFQVCAKRELPELGIDRKFEIPSLFIIDGSTHGIISTNGVKDLETEGDNVLAHWQELQQVVRGLEDKYIDDEE